MLSTGHMLCMERFALFAVQFALLIEFGRVPRERGEMRLQLAKILGMRGDVGWVPFQRLELLPKRGMFAGEFVVRGPHTPVA